MSAKRKYIKLVSRLQGEVKTDSEGKDSELLASGPSGKEWIGGSVSDSWPMLDAVLSSERCDEELDPKLTVDVGRPDICH